jgi:hypothetical protein
MRYLLMGLCALMFAGCVDYTTSKVVKKTARYYVTVVDEHGGYANIEVDKETYERYSTGDMWMKKEE